MPIGLERDLPGFDPVPESGYGLVVVTDPAACRHAFCGPHAIPGARCPNCDIPLMQMMSLDATDPRLQLASLGVHRVPLLFCWRCPLSRGFQYRLLPSGGIELFSFCRGVSSPNFPYSGYPVAFPPASFELTPRSTPPSDRAHQVGGHPLFLQGDPVATCLICKSAMRFLAVVADNASQGWSFAGNVGVQTIFMVCLADGVIDASHEVD